MPGRSREIRPAPRGKRLPILVVVCGLLTYGGAAVGGEGPSPFWRVARLSGDALGCLDGHAESDVAVMACRERCEPIPWQLDERDADNELALPDGPQPNPDVQPGVIDENDELLWMAADAGRRIRSGEAPANASCGLEIELRGPGGTGWVYAFTVPAPAPRSPVRYVEYDPARDVVSSARVGIGFGAPTPRYLALRGADGALGPNLLDRLKVRASARFFGLIPLGRDEDAIQWAFGAWHAGPIRVVRREWQWVQLGWGLRTPVFRSETFVYRDYVELPVRLRLNFPPTYFFTGIEVVAALDFRDLSGWTVHTPHGPIGVVGGLSSDLRQGINAFDGDWLALSGPAATLVLRLRLGESFASLRRQLFYREDDAGFAPEGLAGEHPAVGFRLTEWGEVDRGQHWFAALAYALPAGFDLDQFVREDAAPLAIEARNFTAASRQGRGPASLAGERSRLAHDGQRGEHSALSIEQPDDHLFGTGYAGR